MFSHGYGNHHGHIGGYSDESLYEIFKRFDRNGSGYIEYRELSNILAYLEPHSGSDAIRFLMNNDYNRDGRLNFNEFKNFYRYYRQSRY